MKEYLIAHDMGTSADKATLFTAKGDRIASASVPYEVHYGAGNRAEQNPDDWWNAVCEATRRVLEGIDAKNVAAVSFSGQMQGCVAVDRLGRPLREAIIWADQRAVKQAKELENKIGFDEIHRITGHRVSPAYSIEKLMWLRDNEREVYGNTHRMLQPKDYIILRLTGEFVTDYSDASGTNAFDLEKLEWSAPIVKASGIDPEKLPTPVPSTHVSGTVTKAAAHECGLPVGTPVVCGGGDGPCSTVGAGCIGDGELFATFGTSAWIGATTTKPFLDEKKTLFCFAHVIPGRYMPCGTMQAAGSSYAYIKDTLLKEEAEEALRQGKDPYAALNDLLPLSPVGAKGLLFLPYLMGERSPRWNPHARGAFIGITMEHGREDYLRAVLEGVALNLNVILDAYRSYFSLQEMILTGGGARGDGLTRILCDAMNVSLRRPDHVEEATSIGAAVTAGVGVGLLKDFGEVSRFLKFSDTVHPDPENVRRYDKLKPLFEESYGSLTKVFDGLSTL